MLSNRSIAVIGKGIAGLMTAYFLKEEGFHVAVFSRGKEEGVASLAATGVFSVKGHLLGNSEEYKLKIANQKTFKAFIDELEKKRSKTLDKIYSGASEWILSKAHYQEKRKRLFFKEFFSGFQIESLVQYGKSPSVSMFYPDDFWVDCRGFLRLLEEELREQGVKFENKNIVEIEEDANKAAIISDSKEKFLYSGVVLTTGADSRFILEGLPPYQTSCGISFESETKNFSDGIYMLDKWNLVSYASKLYGGSLPITSEECDSLGNCDFQETIKAKLARKMHEVFQINQNCFRKNLKIRWGRRLQFKNGPLVGRVGEFSSHTSKTAWMNTGYHKSGYSLSLHYSKKLAKKIAQHFFKAV